MADDPVYTAGKGIEFPSSDGFPIHLDYTAIWGILPEQAPDVVRQFGTLKDVEQKVILPQIESICRLHGSRRGAVDLLVGDTREQFQNETSAELERVLTAKKLSLLFGLTRHIYVPKAVREPIQKAKIADELTKTRDQEQLTAKAQADLTEAKAKVVFEEKRTRAETGKMVAEVGAEGEKKAKEIEATTEKLKAEIDAKTAAIEAQTTKAARRGQGQVGQAVQGGQGRALPAPGQGAGRRRRLRALHLRRGSAGRPPRGHLLRRPGHPLDRPERLRADHARQARLRHSGERYHPHEAIVGSGRRRQERLSSALSRRGWGILRGRASIPRKRPLSTTFAHERIAVGLCDLQPSGRQEESSATARGTRVELAIESRALAHGRARPCRGAGALRLGTRVRDRRRGGGRWDGPRGRQRGAPGRSSRGLPCRAPARFGR